MRRRLEASRPRHDLKRGPGGLADLEFIVQYLLLVHSPRMPTCCAPISGTLWRRCAAHGIVSAAIHNELRDAYDFLRTVEDRLRLIHNRGVSELPENPADLERLARRLSDEKVEAGPGGRDVSRGSRPRDAVVLESSSIRSWSVECRGKR